MTDNSELQDYIELQASPGWQRLQQWLRGKAELKPHDLLRNLKSGDKAANDIAICEATAYLTVLWHVDNEIVRLKRQDKADKP